MTEPVSWPGVATGHAERLEQLEAQVAELHAALRGSEVDKDVGIANQHRARLKARIAGNVAAGLVQRRWADDYYDSSDTPSGKIREPHYAPDEEVAPLACEIAEQILEGCGL